MNCVSSIPQAQHHVEHLRFEWNVSSTYSIVLLIFRTEILYLVEHHATTILVGETGSGKTTQVPQYLHEAGWTAGDALLGIVLLLATL